MKAKRVYESIKFQRGLGSEKGLQVGRYIPKEYHFKTWVGNPTSVRVINDTFIYGEIEGKIEFYEEYGNEYGRAYINGSKSPDFFLFKISPAKYEFKNQGRYSEPGYTSYEYPIAKEGEDLNKLMEKYSVWIAKYMDNEKSDKNPFIAVAKILDFVY
jgi:hypothetical protein